MRRNYVALLVWAAIAVPMLLLAMMLTLFPEAGGWALGLGLLLALWFAWELGRRLHRDAERLRQGVELLPEFDREAERPGLPEFQKAAEALRQKSRGLRQSLENADEDRRELEALLDAMQDGVVAVDETNRVQWANLAMQRMLARPQDGQGGGAVRVGHALVQTIRDPEVLECVRLAVEDRGASMRRTTSLVAGRKFEVNATPMPGGGAVAVVHDITRIEEVERTQRDFVANVSHELRTPLTSITGYVETLLDMRGEGGEDALSGQAREFLATILKNATRMNRLTEDLLVMARVEGPAMESHPAATGADVLVRDAVQAMSGLVQENEALLEVGKVVDCMVMADSDAMMQVLGNLIENAIKYGKPRDGSRSRVIVSASEAAGGEAVEFSVQDFGQGIASEHLERIFERFYRVDKTRSRESGGTGLGLAIARHMVQTQGGTIRAESELGAGSRFAFTLPKADAGASERVLDPDAHPGT